MLTTAGWWGHFMSGSTPDLPTWGWMVFSFLTGSLAAALVTIAWNWINARQISKARQEALIASLAGELRRSIILCKHNAELRDNPTPPFVRFPTRVAIRAAFDERHALPKLQPLNTDLEYYTLAMSQINQTIELHDRLWLSVEQATNVSGGASGRRESLRHQISDLCSGQLKLQGVIPDNSMDVPIFLKDVLEKIEILMK